MGDIVNLRRVRKAKAHEADAAAAADNRLRHGRTKAERETAKQQRAAAARKLDHARLDKD